MRARYMIDVTLNSDSDCYSIINGEKMMLDYEVSAQFSTSKTQSLSKINTLIKRLNSICYEDSDRHYAMCSETRQRTYTKIGVAKKMQELNGNLVAALQMAREIIKHGLFNETPFMHEWSAGGNQYFSVKLIVV